MFCLLLASQWEMRDVECRLENIYNSDPVYHDSSALNGFPIRSSSEKEFCLMQFADLQPCSLNDALRRIKNVHLRKPTNNMLYTMKPTSGQPAHRVGDPVQTFVDIFKASGQEWPDWDQLIEDLLLFLEPLFKEPCPIGDFKFATSPAQPLEFLKCSGKLISFCAGYTSTSSKFSWTANPLSPLPFWPHTEW